MSRTKQGTRPVDKIIDESSCERDLRLGDGMIADDSRCGIGATKNTLKNITNYRKDTQKLFKHPTQCARPKTPSCRTPPEARCALAFGCSVRGALMRAAWALALVVRAEVRPTRPARVRSRPRVLHLLRQVIGFGEWN